MKKKLKAIVVSNYYLKWFSFIVYRWFLRLTTDNTLGRNAKVGPSCKLGGKNLFGEGISFIGSEIGFGSYISQFADFKNTKIGKYCSIGPRVKTIHGKHPSSIFVSTHPSFFSPEKRQGFTYVDKQLFKEYPEPIVPGELYTTHIGNDVWIGSDVNILEGIKIGDGAIIAANAMVTKDVPAYSIVGGVPAKFIKMRFDENEIEFLTQLQWWAKPNSWIKENAHLFNDIKNLQNHFNHNIPS